VDRYEMNKHLLLTEAASRLEKAGVDSPRTDARILLAHALGVSREELLAVEKIDRQAREIFEMSLSRRAAREPLAYITGIKEFFSLDFEVGPGVLIPRPETETLIEEALKILPHRSDPLRVLDFGTGSACLAIAFLLQYPNAIGLGIDTSEEAIVWAERNLRRYRLEDRLRFAKGNVQGAFDVVLANPPYLTESEFARAAPEISRHEPKAAFVGGCDGLASYQELASLLRQALAPQGTALVEIGSGQAAPVTAIFEAQGLEVRRLVPDLQGILRCVVAAKPRTYGRDPQKTVGKAPASR
jgi:release factor glutamine methyltransferase